MKTVKLPAAAIMTALLLSGGVIFADEAKTENSDSAEVKPQVTEEQPAFIKVGNGTESVKEPAEPSAEAQPAEKKTFRVSDFDNSPSFENEAKDFYDTFIHKKLSFGVTRTDFKLTDTERPADPSNQETFVGNVNQLFDEDSESYDLSVTYRLCDYLQIGYMNGEVRARTMNFNNHLSDGCAVMKGPMLTLELSYPFLDDMFIPHAGVGYAFWKAHFETDDWWGLGYASPESYEYYGRPKTVFIRHRVINMKSKDIQYFTAGLTFRPLDWLAFDVSYRALEVTSECEFGYARGGQYWHMKDGEFTLDHETWMFTVHIVL